MLLLCYMSINPNITAIAVTQPGPVTYYIIVFYNISKDAEACRECRAGPAAEHSAQRGVQPEGTVEGLPLPNLTTLKA